MVVVAPPTFKGIDMARIDNWFEFGDGIAGFISGHERQDDFTPGKLQWTSKVIELNEKEGYAVTQSGTRYELGEKVQSF